MCVCVCVHIYVYNMRVNGVWYSVEVFFYKQICSVYIIIIVVVVVVAVVTK